MSVRLLEIVMAVLGVCLLFGPCVTVALSDVLALANGRSIDTVYIDGSRYASLESLAAALDLDHEQSFETGVYTLLTPDSRNGPTLSFKPGSRRIVLNKEERFMPVPPVLRGGVVYLPTDPVLSMLRVRKAESGGDACRLVEVTFKPHLDFTRLQFLFSSPTEATTTISADGTGLFVRFGHARTLRPGSSFPVGTAQVASVDFSPSGQDLVGRIALRCRARGEVFSLEAGRRIFVDVIDLDLREGTAGLDRSEFLASCLVMLDPGHGGTDAGCRLSPTSTEKWFTLRLAKRLGKKLAQDGIEVRYSRSNDMDLPLLSRLDALNAASPDVVVSLHGSLLHPGEGNGENPERSTPTVSIIVLDEPPGSAASVADTQAPSPGGDTPATATGAPASPSPTENAATLAGLYSPSPEEIRSAFDLARHLQDRLASVPGVRCSTFRLPHVLPLVRTLSPGVMLDFAGLSDLPAADSKRFTDALLDATRQGILDFFDELFRGRNTVSAGDGMNPDGVSGPAGTDTTAAAGHDGAAIPSPTGSGSPLPATFSPAPHPYRTSASGTAPGSGSFGRTSEDTASSPARRPDMAPVSPPGTAAGGPGPGHHGSTGNGRPSVDYVPGPGTTFDPDEFLGPEPDQVDREGQE